MRALCVEMQVGAQVDARANLRARLRARLELRDNSCLVQTCAELRVMHRLMQACAFRHTGAKAVRNAALAPRSRVPLTFADNSAQRMGHVVGSRCKSGAAPPLSEALHQQ